MNCFSLKLAFLGVLLAKVLFAAPLLEKTDLFVAGEGGYVIYRIPGVVVTAKGTILAYCEARKSGRSDWATMDVMLRRSEDGGKAWGAPVIISGVLGEKKANPVAVRTGQDSGGPTYNNPTAVVTRDGAIHFFYCLEYMRSFHIRSEDDGRTWSAPVEVTEVFDRFRPEYNWKVLSTGPGHGIELANGRILVAVRLATGETPNRNLRPTAVATIFSDDRGRTWQRGDIAIVNSETVVNPNEPLIVQLADGSVILNARNETAHRRRVVVTSPDGATSWSKPRFDPALIDSGNMAALTRLTQRPPDDRNRLLFANTHHLSARENLSVKMSLDEGQTWPMDKVLERGPSAYCDLAVLPDSTMLCFYERGSVDSKELYGRLTMARFNLEWLTDGAERTESRGP